jgi:hypothetical protein
VAELVAPLPLVVAVTPLLELAGALTEKTGAALMELAGLAAEVGAVAGLEESAGAPADVGAVSALGELVGTVAGVGPLELVAAPLSPVRNWSTAAAMSWNRLAKKLKNRLASELVAVLLEAAEGAGGGAEPWTLLEVVAAAGLDTAVGAATVFGAATVVGGAVEFGATDVRLPEAAAAWPGPFELETASCS